MKLPKKEYREYIKMIAKRKLSDKESNFLLYMMYDLLYIQENNAVEIIVDKLLKLKIALLENQEALYKRGVFSPANGWVFPCGK